MPLIDTAISCQVALISAIIPHSERMFVLGCAMALRLLLTLPLPPGVNNQYVTVNGRRVLSPEARRYKQGVLKLLRRKRDLGDISDELCVAARRGYLALFIDFFFETPMRRDLDGGLKIAQDAICTALEVNDNRVVDIHLGFIKELLHPRLPKLGGWSVGRWCNSTADRHHANEGSNLPSRHPRS